MAWPEKLKLHKRLVQSISESGYTEPTEIQFKTLSRISGGQDLIAVGPQGCGKTSTYILTVLNRLRYNTDGVPKVLILVPDKEQVLAVVEQFDQLNTNKSLLMVGLYAAPGTEAQMNALADGSDIVVATPDRARAIYLKLGLNLNKMELFIVDDADQIVQKNLQLPVTELANSITKSQRLVFTAELNEKVNKMIAPFMKLPALVEVTESGEIIIEPNLLLLADKPDMEEEVANNTKQSLVKAKPDPDAPGDAFHEKKAKNSKTSNYGAGQKAKMTNKRKH